MLMNRDRFLVALSFMFAMLFAACDDDNEKIGGDNNDPTVIEKLYCKLLNNQDVNKDGGKFFWAVEANGNWTLDGEALPDWLSVEPLQGKVGTTHTMLEFAELTDGKERSFVLPFVLGEETVNITVKQVPEGGVEEEEWVCRFTEKQVFGKGGGTLNCTLEASVDWELSGYPDWLTVSPVTGQAGLTELTLTAGASGGMLRVGVLTFVLGDETVDVVVNQSLNDSYPTLSVDQDAKVSGNVATLYGSCAFESDELAIEKIGFLYRAEGDTEWIDLTSESSIENGTFTFEKAETFSWGTIYEYKPYALLNGTIYEGEVRTFTIERRTIEDGIWYYENFDGMYNPETKEYTAFAKSKNYDIRDLDDFNTNGGFLRKNQPNAQYRSVKSNGTTNYFRCNPKCGGNDGRISAQIKPDDVTSSWNLPEGTSLYPGASGNWKYISYYETGLTLTITGLDFTGAGNLQLSVGCMKEGSSTDKLPDGFLEIFVSVDGEQWDKVEYSYVQLTLPAGAQKYWKQVVVDNISDRVTALRLGLPTYSVGAIDDIKMIAQP